MTSFVEFWFSSALPTFQIDMKPYFLFSSIRIHFPRWSKISIPFQTLLSEERRIHIEGSQVKKIIRIRSERCGKRWDNNFLTILCHFHDPRECWWKLLKLKFSSKHELCLLFAFVGILLPSEKWSESRIELKVAIRLLHKFITHNLVRCYPYFKLFSRGKRARTNLSIFTMKHWIGKLLKVSLESNVTSIKLK